MLRHIFLRVLDPECLLRSLLRELPLLDVLDQIYPFLDPVFNVFQGLEKVLVFQNLNLTRWETTHYLQLNWPWVQPMLLPVLFDEGKSQLLWVFVNEFSFLYKDFGLHQDLILDDFKSDVGNIVAFKDDPVGQVEVEKSQESRVL